MPKRHLIGNRGEGWTVGKRLLQYERSSIGGMGGARQIVTTIDELAMMYLGEEDARIAHPGQRADIVEYNMNQHAYQLTMVRSMQEATTSKAPTFMSSFFKVYGTSQNMRRQELAMSIVGNQGLGWVGDEFSPEERGTTRQWLRSKANSIEGGSSEVMRNIVAKRILGLPD